VSAIGDGLIGDGLIGDTILVIIGPIYKISDRSDSLIRINDSAAVSCLLVDQNRPLIKLGV